MPVFCSPDCPSKESGSCYSNHKCRCKVCRAANARRVARRRAQRNPAQVPDKDHGKPSTYINWNCRCRPCTDAHSAAWAAQEANRRRKAN